MPAPRRGHAAAAGLAICGLLGTGGCVTQGDFLRLQEKVVEMEQANRGAPEAFARLAQLSADVDAMREEIRQLEGQVEVARKESADALTEARLVRTDAVLQSSPSETSTPEPTPVVPEDGDSEPAPDQELAGYQEALEARRGGDYPACIERFTAFLQSYPTSSYADDAAYWLADCTYQNEEYKRAVIRFSDVVRVYPDSPKAPDALYRQGESLLKLGPRFEEAARTVFRRLQDEYPDSERAGEAGKQLERLGPGENAAT